MADSTETQNQKRSFTEQSDILIDVKGILLNVEGATAPLTFVRDELFSYAKKNVGAFVEAHWSDEELKGFIDTLREQAEKDQADGVQGVVVVPGKDADAAEIKKAVISNFLWQLGQGRQANLSTLLVQIWKEAYDSGELIGEVYEDVLPALEEWKELGKKIYGYTSGGVEAAKLLFAHTSDGDLSDMLSGYFDSTAGPKTDKESYVKIAEHLGTDASQVIYLTDIPAEAAAATAAGLKTCLVMREGNVTLSEEEQRTYQAVESFYELMKEDIDELPDAKRHGDDYSDSNDVVYQGEQFRGGQLEDSNSRSLQHNEESFGAEEDEEEDDGEEDDA